ncbi:MAG: c-type cytochrome biogenesis protein CcsB [Motilibacteraceae bacterium]
MSSTTLAGLSNDFVYSAIVVYACAMVAVAAEFAFGHRAGASEDVVLSAAESGALAPTVAKVPAAVGAGVGSSLPPVPAAPPVRSRRREEASRRAVKLSRIGVSLTALGFALHLLGVVTRGLAAGRAPFGNMYEFTITCSLAITAAYLVLLRKYDVRYLGIVVVPTVLLCLGLAMTVLYVDAEQLVPALHSVWLVIHVLAAIVSAGAFSLGAGLAALYLLRSRAERRSPASLATGWLGRLPSAARLDTLTYRVHAFVFPLWTFAIIAGAIWAENAWGRYWGWDPKETWAFITWVFYAAYLHARATAGWRGGKAATICLLGFAALTFNFFGVNIFITGLHSYAGI